MVRRIDLMLVDLATASKVLVWQVGQQMTQDLAVA